MKDNEPSKEYKEYKSIFFTFPEYKDHKNVKEKDSVTPFKLIQENDKKFKSDFQNELKYYENIHRLNEEYMKYLKKVEAKFQNNEKLSYQEAYSLVKSNSKLLINSDKCFANLKNNLNLFVFGVVINYGIKIFIKSFLNNKLDLKVKSSIKNYNDSIYTLKKNRRISSLIFLINTSVMYFFYDKNARKILFENVELNKDLLKSIITKNINK